MAAPAVAGGELVRIGWLRGPRFDLALIVGVLALALLLGGAALTHPALFTAVLLVDLWLLAYPHVASTFTRVAFDRQSLRAHRWLVLGLPPLVLAATAAAAWAGGAIALNTIYFYWQSYHYTRQSYGIARAYRRTSEAGARGRDWLTDAVVFAFPIWGVLHRAEEHQPAFYGAPFYSPPVPKALVVVAGAVALVALGGWTIRQARALRAGSAELGYTMYVASHVAITAVSYLAIAEITRGWLFINVWHNAQYLLFVWAANARRFSRGVDAGRPFISWLSQRGQVGWYAAICLGLSTVFYLALGATTTRLSQEILPIYLVAHLAVNFHHYLLDAVIWRAPGPRRAGADGSVTGHR